MNNIVPAKTLQERVGDRIREQIGDLLTDDDLKKLVDKAMQDAFFTRRVQRNSYGSIVKDEPPEIVSTVTNLMKERVDAALTAWLNDNPAVMRKVIEDVIAAGMIGFVADWFRARSQGDLMIFGNNMVDMLRNKGVNL